ncbi:hypothetical protein U9R90_02375 [Streptomyces sp. E11-3]|uniref:hypothetical protein n=1 Tax=Streptomyces sp. E11-3 TaxID=3110112 RepID=UPI003980414A
MMDDELRRRLRDAAHAHQPDRERMLARVERGMAERRAPRMSEPRTPRASWVRVVSATAAVAGVFALGGYAVASAVRGPETPPQTVATTPGPETETEPGAPERSPEPSRTPDPPTQPPSSTPKPPPASTTGPTRSAPTQPEPETETGSKTVPVAELLWADGSIDPGSSAYWGQSNLTIKARKPLTALTVELRVAQTGQVADTGNWRSLPAEDFDVTVREQGGALVYRWTLKSGRTVPVGEHVFAGQYNHAEGQRDAGDDTYRIEADTSDERAEWKGDFAPTSD